MRVYDDPEIELSGGEWVARGVTKVWVPTPTPRVHGLCIDCGHPVSRDASRCRPCNRINIGKISRGKPKARRQINHGTPAGYRAHMRRKEPLCDPCREAQREYRTQARQRATPVNERTEMRAA